MLQEAITESCFFTIDSVSVNQVSGAVIEAREYGLA